jgi:hypothetical protein
MTAHRHGLIAELWQRADDGTVAHRWVLAMRNHAFGFFDGIDMRHHDTLRARIEQARSVMMLLAWHTHDGGNAYRQRRDGHL